MKIHFAAFILLFVLISFSAPLFGQESFNLQQLITYAQKNNTQAMRTQNQFEQSAANYKRNMGNLMPTLNGNATHSYNFGRTIDPTTNLFIEQRTQTNFFNLNTDLLLFNGLQQINSIRQAKWAQDASYQSIQRIKDDIALTVANYYLQILMLNEREKQLTELVNLSKAQHERTKIMVQSGAFAPSRELETDAQLATDEVLLLDVQNEIINTYLQLKQYLNYDVQKELVIETIELADPSVEYQRADLDKALENQYKQNPQVKQMESQVQSERFAVMAAKGNISPKIYANASLRSGYSSAARQFDGYSIQGVEPVGFFGPDTTLVYAPRAVPLTSFAPFRTQIDNNFGQTLGFSLVIPIFNNFQNNYNIQLAKISHVNSQLNLRDAQLKVKNDMMQAFESMRIAQRKFQAASTKMKAQEALFRQSEFSYNEGALSYYDWNTIKSNFTTAQSEVLQAKYQHIFQTKVFEYYLGKPVQIGE